MQRKVFLFCVLFVLLVSIISFINAADLNVSDDGTLSESQKKNNAYECVEDKIDEKKCSGLSSEERVFSLMATGECGSEVKSDSKFKSDIKFTSQAILGLKGDFGAEEWLLSQDTVPSNLEWYLQIESQKATTCDIDYGSLSSTIFIGEDKKIDSPAGNCLSLSEGSYWLKVSTSSSCRDVEFEISCDEGFQTSLLFKKTGFSTVYVSSDVKGASANGKVTQKVDAVCFATGSECDYESNLWAALALDKDNDINSYKPYLVTMAEVVENEKFLPEAFLYALGDDSYRTTLLLKQESEKWWSKSGDKFYDTAVALLPFSGDSSGPEEKTNTKEWLLDIQDTDGCWNNGNLRDTAFLLYSIWPKSTGGGGGGGGGGDDCEDQNNYCITKYDCGKVEGSEVDYSCPVSKVCCTKDKVLPTCLDIPGGKICDSDKICSGGRTETDISDNLGLGDFCCVEGDCKTRGATIEDTCVSLGKGTCQFSCEEEYESDFNYNCASISDYCCVKKKGGGFDSIWIWVLGGLIVLVLLGIVFRNKLRRFLVRLKSGKRKSGGGTSGPGGPFFTPPSSRMPIRRPPMRMMPPRRPGVRPPLRRPPAPRRKPSGDLDNVLKKLKEMGQ